MLRFPSTVYGPRARTEIVSRRIQPSTRRESTVNGVPSTAGVTGLRSSRDRARAAGWQSLPKSASQLQQQERVPRHGATDGNRGLPPTVSRWLACYRACGDCENRFSSHGGLIRAHRVGHRKGDYRAAGGPRRRRYRNARAGPVENIQRKDLTPCSSRSSRSAVAIPMRIWRNG